MKNKIFFSKLKEEAIIPSKRDEDACYDVYACFEQEEITILPNEIKLIPTGIASACDLKYRFALRERGSTGTRGMAFRAGQIDSGYRDEWFIPINNTGNKPIVISKLVSKVEKLDYAIFYPYKKAIVSVALEFVPDVIVEEIPYDELKKIESERGMGALGSSGK